MRELSIAEQLDQEFEDRVAFAFGLPGKWELFTRDTIACWERYREQTHKLTVIERFGTWGIR